MRKMPSPAALVELARSAGRSVVDREWKQYQRYLAKYQQQHANMSDEPPLNFEEFCANLRKNKNRPPETQNHP